MSLRLTASIVLLPPPHSPPPPLPTYPPPSTLSHLHRQLWGYTYYGANVLAIACGYFIWDILISAYMIKEHGWVT